MQRWLAGLGLAVVVVGGATGIAVWRTTASGTDATDAADATAAQVITVSRSSCGNGWTDPKPGPQAFQVHNTGSVTTEADIVDPATGTVFGELEGIGPGTTRTLEVTLGNGTYAFRCAPEETDPITGPAVTITGGDARSGPAVVPVTRNDLLGPLRDYKSYVTTGLDQLAGDTDKLRDAVHSGNRAAAEGAWLTAHLSYERLGAAYDAFGDSDGAINGTTDGLPGGAADEDFTGFHRLENGLWHGEDMTTLGAVGDRLDSDVHELKDGFGDEQIDPNDLGLRAHEILENTLQFELTGRTDYGSGTNLATAVANVDGTRAVLDVLHPLLVPRLPQLSDVDNWLNRTEVALKSAQRPDGSWTPVNQLSREQREKIDADVSGAVERLAPVAAITEPRRVS